MATGGINLSKDFFELLKAIGESKSKQEEDRIVLKEIATLKQKMDAPPPSTSGGAVTNALLGAKKRAKEFLVRLLYVEMLGHDASFGYIKAVEMAASSSLYHKRTGYLVCGACLAPDHAFRFMLVNQMQRDLQSSNVLEIAGSLLAATRLITSDMVPAMATEVSKLLAHDSETVRKKAIICLHRFHELDDGTVTRDELLEKVRKVLCDRDPAVMGSCLNVIESMAVADVTPFKDLIPSLVSILKQICEHRLPSEFDYHRVPAPWMQVKLVRILSMLGQADATASSGMYEILNDTMKKADIGINAGYAIVYECIKCITKIYPNPKLLDTAADSISMFIQSRSHNLKYLGVTGLAMIVESHPQYAAQHQMLVMDCLEDPDETLQRKTLDLLYRMTNPVNVEFITEKLLDFMKDTTDPFLKQQLTTRVCSVAERYAPNNAWYIRTITQLFEISGDMVKTDVAQNLMSLIAEGAGESEEADMLLRQNAVELYVQLLQGGKPPAKFPKILLETLAWCLGEYAYLSAVCTLEEVLSKLCTLAQEQKARLPASTRKFLTSAICKLVAQAGTCPAQAATVIQEYTRSKDPDLQQRCLEFQGLLTTAPHLLGQIFPVDASAEDVEVDVNLSFLDGFCQDALATGAKAYNKPEDDDDDDEDGYGDGSSSQPAFKMTPYEKPQTPGHVNSYAMRGVSSAGQTYTTANGVTPPPGSNAGTTMQQPVQVNAAVGANNALSLNTRGVANVWGKGGLSASAPAPPPAPAPAPAAPTAAPGGQNAFATHMQAASGSQYGGYGASAAPPPAPVPVEKTKEQLEKERMAAALFGGMVPGQAPPPPSQASAPVAPPPPKPAPVQAPPPAAAPPVQAPPVQAPPVEVDLLDLGGFDSTPAPVPAAAPGVDIFAAAPMPAPEPAAPPPVVETVSDDEVAPPAAPVPAAAAAMADPFAAEGLLGDLTDAPLATLSTETSQKFEYGGSQMAPLQITTPEFGQNWGTCPAVSPASLQSGKIVSLDQFMEAAAQIGLHPIEAIAATNEGICAGVVNGAILVLVHGKVSPLGNGQSRLDVTVKSSDAALPGTLALYIQTMMK